MKWHFPLIRVARKDSNERLTKKVLQELEEFERETDTDKKAMEAIDVLYAAETLVRVFFSKYPSLSFDKIKQKIVKNNKRRGYYKDKRE